MKVCGGPLIMNDDMGGSERPALRFDGSWSGFFRLAFLNIILTIVTIGIYRFWAKTRVRRYLWSKTVFVDQPLEYTGRGIELLIGAMLVFLLLILPFTLLSVAASVLQGMGLGPVSMALNLVFYAAAFWLFGFAVWRAQRYRLSRTRWRGIRGGMEGDAKRYAWLSIKMTLLNLVTLGFAQPYTTVRRWNALWNDARFGSAAVHAAAEWRPLMRVFIGSWAMALVLIGVVGFWAFWQLPSGFSWPVPGQPQDPANVLALTKVAFLGLVVIAVGLVFILLRYGAALMQAVVAGTSLDTLEFRFGAGTGDWLRYYIGNLVLVVLTLGIGGLLLPYRFWSFHVRHLDAMGSLDADRLMQTTLAQPGHGEGLADALDIGAV